MATSICACGNDVYIPIVKETNEFEVMILKYDQGQSSDELPSFVKHTSLFLENDFVESLCSRVLSISKVGFFQTGLEKAIVLVRHGQDIIYVISCPYTNENKFLQIMAKFVIPDFKYDSCKDLMAVTYGPTIIYIQNPNILFMVPPIQDHVYSNLNNVLRKNLCVNKILHFTSVQTVQDLSNVSVYLLSLALCDVNYQKQCIGIYFFSYNIDKHFLIDEMCEIPLHMFFPPCYETVLSSLFISLLPSFINTDLSFDLKKGNYHWQENYTVICTQAKQCLIFQKGKMKIFCSIPTPDVSNIVVTCPWMPFNKWQFFLSSSSKNVSWLNLKTDEQLECIETWNEASEFVIGDFCKNGTKQILLYFEALFDITPEDFMLFQILPSYNMLIPSKTVNIHDYTKCAIVKLKEKVEMGHSWVLEAQRDIVLKTAHTFKLMKMIFKKNEGNDVDYNTKQDNWLNDIVIHKEIEMESLDSENVHEKALKVVDSWKILKKKALVFGWTLKNISDSCVYRVDGNIVADLMPPDYRVTVFIHDEDSFGLTKMKRKHVIPGEMVSIVISWRLPKLLENKFEFLFIISWNVGVSKGSNDDIILQKGRFPDQQISLDLSFHSDEILRTRWIDCTDHHLQELLSFRSTQEVLHLCISTENSQFSFADIVSLQEPPFTMKVKEHKKWKWGLFNDYSCVLHGVSLTWTHHSSDILEAYTYFRNESEIVLFVRWLYDILPYDATILPVDCLITQKPQLQKKFFLAMKDELDLLRVSLSHQSVPMYDDNETKSACEYKNAYLSCKRYYKMKKTMSKREFFTDDLVCKLYNLDKYSN